MEEITLRAPLNDDWAAILNLAHRSLAEIPAAPSQKAWLENRKSFPLFGGIQRQLVVTSRERIVGYAGIEHRTTDEEGWYRLFMVVEPAARATLGIRLFAKLREDLINVGAHHAWMMEYEADAGFVTFLERVGFVRDRIVDLEDGMRAVRLTIDSPFHALLQEAIR